MIKLKLYEGSPLFVAKEMEQTRKTLLEIAGIDSKLTGAPIGSHPYMTEEFRDGLFQQNMKMWDWNVDTVDWKYHDSNPQVIVENAVKGINESKDGNDPIVMLLHVTKGTATVLPEIIDYISNEGLNSPLIIRNSTFQ